MELARESLDVDVACVGFGPATGGFLTTLVEAMSRSPEAPAFRSRAVPGLPLQVVCYERADDLGFGVSGAVTRARGIRASFPGLDAASIPPAHPVTEETVVYLSDPAGPGRRSRGVRILDRVAGLAFPRGSHAARLPLVPGFLKKEGGLVLSVGQFNQWVGSRLMSSGLVQIWPGMPAVDALYENDRVIGLRLIDQGTDRWGFPGPAALPGMDIRSRLLVVGDGPVGAVGRGIDRRFGLPPGHRGDAWALGMKAVVGLAADHGLEPGTVLHTLGYPEPEIFGFLYVLAERTASLGIFVPSWLRAPAPTPYRYLQHWMRHPYLRELLEGATLRSWGAKSLLESGRSGEPYLVGDGYARIGEGSGTTNVLTGSGVDEAWTSGVLLAEGVITLLEEDRPFGRADLEATYVARRRASWLDAESRAAAHARAGFEQGMLRGLWGMGLAGMTGGRLHVADAPPPRRGRSEMLERDLEAVRGECARTGVPVHEALLERAGWPAVPLDGELLVSHQDALLRGGKVYAADGYADHVVFLDPERCAGCAVQRCVAMCSGQAITSGEGGVPRFDREKCVHCGACLWNCARLAEGEPANLEFRAGAGGLHSTEN
jgi:electron-transferring-flavoprotein dehydrogenase